ncbi:MAG: LysM peptidoglycan-binding domain-containing protein [Lachnospiraceae bacterium]|nr:LysM peptidoglycan-binding domain-containing protein [Lachnospiraceae bacterium]
MTGTPVNMECTIENFTWGENDGTKDINFTLELKEYRKVKVKTANKENEELQRTAKEVKSTTYTVVKGDNLSKIAKNLTGNSANWRTIYSRNKGVIGDNPNLIYPGQELVIDI